MQKSAHAGAHVRDAVGVSGGLHGAAGDAADASRPPAGECQPHPRDGARGEARHIPRHARRIDSI